MKEDVVLVILEHVRYKLNIHILNIDLLYVAHEQWAWAELV